MFYTDYKVIPSKTSILIKSILQFITIFLLLLSLNFFAFGVVFDVAVVDGSSMLPTLNANDTQNEVYIHRFLTYDIGSIIVVENEQVNKDIIKRVVALPGDTVKIAMAEDNKYYLYRNGEKQSEDFIYSREDMLVSYNKFRNMILSSEHQSQIITDEIGDQVYLVPKDHVFVLGDNRGNSEDSSRYGAFSSTKVKGTVKYIVPKDTDYNFFVICKFLGIC